MQANFGPGSHLEGQLLLSLDDLQFAPMRYDCSKPLHKLRASAETLLERLAQVSRVSLTYGEGQRGCHRLRFSFANDACACVYCCAPDEPTLNVLKNPLLPTHEPALRAFSYSPSDQPLLTALCPRPSGIVMQARAQGAPSTKGGKASSISRAQQVLVARLENAENRIRVLFGVPDDFVPRAAVGSGKASLFSGLRFAPWMQSPGRREKGEGGLLTQDGVQQVAQGLRKCADEDIGFLHVSQYFDPAEQEERRRVAFADPLFRPVCSFESEVLVRLTQAWTLALRSRLVAVQNANPSSAKWIPANVTLRGLADYRNWLFVAVVGAVLWVLCRLMLTHVI